MTAEFFDLGQRFRAADAGAPVARMKHAPCLPLIDPLVVRVTGTNGVPIVETRTATATASARGRDALTALVSVGLDLDSMPRTIVVPDPGTTTALARLARANADPGLADVAATIGWWEQRAEHPGTGTVLTLTAACRERWVLGTAPAAERHVATWLNWLRLTDPRDATGPLLALAHAVSAGDPLPGLAPMRESDDRSWQYFHQQHQAGRDWRARDTRTMAAMGLATREDAAELYASVRMQDPLTAVREQFTGNLVTGVVQSSAGRGPVVITTHQPMCRLRPDTAVQGWKGTADQVGVTIAASTGGAPGSVLSADLADVVTEADRSLRLTLRAVTVRGQALRPGDTVTLRGAPVSHQQQLRGRINLSDRYRVGQNWLGSGAAPVPRRRDVPLDIAISAADD